MKVSAVIPTIGRPEVVRAVRSVLSQTVSVEPVVVLDRPEREPELRELLEDLPHKLVITGGSTGGAAARNLGVAHSDGDMIAFIDDDDEWLPEKTAQQLELAQNHPAAVITSRALLVGRSERIVPETAFESDRPISNYLLERATLTLRRNFVQSSTLLMSQAIVKSFPWRESLPRHQDWGLLIDLDRSGVSIVTHPDPLVRVYQGSIASISQSTNWRASEAWLVDYGADANERARADFLCSIVLRSALAAGEWRPALSILRRALFMRPHPAALVVGFSGLARFPGRSARS